MPDRKCKPEPTARPHPEARPVASSNDYGSEGNRHVPRLPALDEKENDE